MRDSPKHGLAIFVYNGSCCRRAAEGLPGWLAHSPRGWDGPVHRHSTAHCTLHNTLYKTPHHTAHCIVYTDTAHRHCTASFPGLEPVWCQYANSPESESTDTDCSLHPLSASHSGVPSYAPKELSLHAELWAKIQIFMLNAGLYICYMQHCGAHVHTACMLQRTHPCYMQGCGEPLHVACRTVVYLFMQPVGTISWWVV